MKLKKRNKVILIVSLAVFIPVIIIVFVKALILFVKQDNEIVDSGMIKTNYDEQKAIYIDGVRYLPDTDTYTLLLGGVDKYGKVESSNYYKNNEQVDFLALIIFNRSGNTVNIVHINRDTMTEVSALDIFGNQAGTSFEQIALSHTYGTGLKDSCENTVRTVERLFGNIKIDNYIIMKLDAIEIINDSVGGVPVTISDDFSKIDDTLVKGRTINLNSSQAINYIKERKNISDETNLSRMKRQKEYIQSFYNQLKKLIDKKDSYISSTFNSIADYIVTDCDISKLMEICDSINNYPEAKIEDIKGNVKNGSEYIEYYVDSEALEQLKVRLLYKEVEQ